MNYSGFQMSSSKLINSYLESTGYKCFKPKAVMFDMDGVIFDSMPNHAKSWHESMKAIGLKMRPEDAYIYEGMRGVETIKLLAKQQWNRELTDDEATDFYKIKSEHFNSCQPPKLMDGIIELMQKIKRKGLKIVIVTGSAQHTLINKLNKTLQGLVSADLIVTSHDVKHGKPNPEPYIMGMKKAGVNPNEAIIVENAPLGVRAGVAANVFTIAVNTGPLSDSNLKIEGANIILPSIRALLEQWEKLFNNMYTL